MNPRGRIRAIGALVLLVVLFPMNPAAAGRPGSPLLQAAGRGAPWITLTDGEPVPTVYQGAAALAVQEARPLSLAGADFDGDGALDVAAGYAGPAGGIVALHRGRLAHRAAPLAGGPAGPAFLAEAQTCLLPAPADFLVTGDFNADGRPDLVAAARGGAALYLLAGDGAGAFSAPQALALSGPVTALAAGDVNRRDGLEDLLVGVGATLLVYEGPAGAWSAQPEALPLPAPAAAIALGQLDDAYPLDVAVAAGAELLIVAGRDRQLTLPAARRGSVPAASVRRIPLPAAALSLALGDFVAADGGRRELALLLADGTLRVLDRAGAEAAALPAAGTQLLRAKLSSLPADEVLVLDPAGQQVHIVMADGRRLTAAGYKTAVPSGILASLDLSGAPAAVLPAFLNGDALTDLVVLAASADAPLVVPTRPANAFVVDIGGFSPAADAPDMTPGDGLCRTGAGYCTLRAALQEANATAGADAISFNLPSMQDIIYPQSPLPTISEALTIEGPAAPGTPPTLDGGSVAPSYQGLRISGGGSMVRRLILQRWGPAALALVDEDANQVHEVTVQASGLGIEVLSSFNTVAHCGVVFNEAAGIRVGAGEQSLVYENTVGVVPDAGHWLPAGNGEGIFLDQVDNTTVQGNTIGDSYSGYGAGAGLRLAGCQGSLARGNRIGDAGDASGDPLGNGVGLLVEEGQDNNLGTTTDHNVVSGNHGHGIILSATQGNLVLGNYIGTDVGGAAAVGNTFAGVHIYHGSANAVGGTAAGSGNVIAGNGTYGVSISGSAGTGANQVLGNWIGTDAAGTAALGNTLDGVFISGSGADEIGGPSAGAENLISANGRSGILLGSTVTQTRILGNWIGLDSAGAALGNGGHGIYVQGGPNAAGVVIGGPAGGAGNVISSNGGHGIFGDGVTGCTIQGNVIGADPAGTLDRGNAGCGIDLQYATNNLIGGAAAGEGNLVSGNDDCGIEILWHGQNTIAGNKIGTNTAGTGKINNGGAGIYILGHDNTIGGSAGTTPGGPCTGACNLVAGNLEQGIVLSGDGNVVRGNYIGTDRTGTTEMHNRMGIAIMGDNNAVGGSSAAEANLVSSNLQDGIGVGGDGNAVTGNLIGTQTDGSSPLGNWGNGIAIEGGDGNRIGGAGGQGNTIAYNFLAGVWVTSGDGNTLAANTMYENRDLGVDLAPTGVTPNDPGDPDTGPNGRQNYPLIAAVVVSTSAEIQGSVNSTPDTALRIDLYRNDACDDSGYGEGQTWLAAITVTTDADGNASFDATVPGAGLYGKYVTAMATAPDGSTSEFAACVLGVAGDRPPIVVNETADAADPNAADGICDVDTGTPGEQCTVRAAVETADAVVGADIILVPAGTYLLTLAGTGDTGGDLDVNTDMAIHGAGANVTIVESTVADRVVQIFGTTTAVQITGVTLAGGSATGTNYGGAVNNEGRLTLDAVTVRDSTANMGGGGIHNTGVLTVTNSAIVSNTAVIAGGGVFQFSGTTVIANSTVAANETQGSGGGIAALGGTVWLNNVTVAYNTADSDNTNGGDGGGLYRSGGITFTASNSIVGENVDMSHGIYPYGAADCAGTFGSRGYSLISDRGYNRTSGDIACQGFDDDATNLVGGFYIFNTYIRYETGLDPHLSENGGSTPNLALFSPYYGVAIDSGNPAEPGSGPDTCLAADQRGQPRPVDGNSDDTPRCDMGAFEYVPVTIDIGDAVAGEDSTAALEVMLSQPAGITITVDYSTTAGTAQPGEDFVTSTGTLTFVIGADAQTISVPVLADTWDEVDESFHVTLYDPSFVFLGKAQGVVTILDDDEPPAFSVGDVAVEEGDPQRVTHAFVTITLSAVSNQDTSVEVLVAAGTAVSGEDYLANDTWLLFPAGTTMQTVRLAILGDDLDEDDETVLVALADPANAVIADGEAIVTITDDDTAALTAADFAVFEGGSSDTVNLYFAVRLAGPSTREVTVHYATADGTAKAGSDYTAASGDLTFAPGDTSEVVVVAVLGDGTAEADETLFLNLSAPTGGAVLFDWQGVGTIRNDDEGVVIYRVYLPMVPK